VDEQDINRRRSAGRGPRRAGEPPAPGVRIIGAEEASSAVGSGEGRDEAGGREDPPVDRDRRSDVEWGDFGPGGRSSRLSLPEDADDATVESFHVPDLSADDAGSRRDMRAAASRFLGMDDELDAPGDRREPAEDTSVPEMLHWSEPATGEVPRILADDPDDLEPEDELTAWASRGRGPSWRGDHLADWDDDQYEPAVLGDEETRVGAMVEPNGEPDLYSFDVLDPPTGEWQERDDARETTFDPSFLPGEGRRSPRSSRRSISSRGGGGGGSRSIPVALTTGIGAGVVALILFKIGPVAALLLCIVVVTLAAAELFAVLRRAGYQPATLLGLVATVALMIATYIKGETAIPLIVALTVVFSMLWYLAGVVKARPMVNVATTVLAVSWVGVLGSFAGLLLDPRAFPNRHGIAFLAGAIIAAISYDVGGLVVGRVGRRQLAPVTSPNKTWEGLVGGMVASILVSTVIVGQIHPWTIKRALLLGVVVAVVAPLGDLCESMIKRDIGIKDMSSILPGHGGVLDRVDAILFVLPATYYLVRLINIG
jgi:phosphatidate cytidylyltransferase